MSMNLSTQASEETQWATPSPQTNPMAAAPDFALVFDVLRWFRACCFIRVEWTSEDIAEFRAAAPMMREKFNIELLNEDETELSDSIRFWVDAVTTCVTVGLLWVGWKMVMSARGQRRDDAVVELVVPARVAATAAWEPRLAASDSCIVRDQRLLLESGCGADCAFEVGGEIVRAHTQFLLARAPALAALCADAGFDEPTVIPAASPALFKEVLRFVYTDGISVDVVQREGAALLELADLFGCSRLKVAVECKLANSASSLTVDTLAAQLLFADAHRCPLLKERALEFFAHNAAAVMTTPGWARLSEQAALLAELMAAMVGPKERSQRGPDAEQMDVSDMRRALDEANLDVDGSRSQLEQRLRDHMRTAAGRADGRSSPSAAS